jgi:hypothetical protein
MAFEKYIPNYWLNLIVPNEITNFASFSTELGEVLEVIKASDDEKEMDRVINGNPKFSEIGNDVISVLNTFTGLNLALNKEGEKTDMCKAWEDHKKSGIHEGEIKERERLNKLNAILIANNRYDDLKRSTEDKQFQTELLDELVPECN